MKKTAVLRRVAPLAVLAVVGAGVPVLLGAQAQAADSTVVGTRFTDHGWSTSTTGAGGAVSYQPDADGPLGGYVALLRSTGRVTLDQSEYAGTPLADLVDLGYRTKNLTAGAAPRLEIDLTTDDGAQGTLVYDPADNVDSTGQAADVGTQHTWDADGRNARWTSTEDVVDADGDVVLAAGTPHRLGAFLDAYDANPDRYAGLRVADGPSGIDVALLAADGDTVSAEVDGVTLGTVDGTATYDFESLGDCTTFDKTTKTLTLVKDCSTTTTQQMGDGWTFYGGDYYTLRAVENAESPNFPGAVVASAAGTTTDPATLTVKGLFIDAHLTGTSSGGRLTGIRFDHAGGSVSDSVVAGITHGNGVQEGWAVLADNTGGVEVPLALKDSTLRTYQKTGAKLVGNLDVSVSGMTVGRAEKPDGSQLTGIGANAMSFVSGAHGSITHSVLEANRYSLDDTNTGAEGEPPSAESTGLLLFDSGAVTATDLRIIGTDADAGIAVTRTADDLPTSLSLSCSSVTNDDDTSVPADPEVSIGLDNADDAPVSVQSTTFSGWRQTFVGDVTTGSAESCGQNAAITVAAARSALGAGQNAKLTGTVKVGNDPLVGAAVQLLRKQGKETAFTEVANGVTGADGSYELKDVPSLNAVYEVSVTRVGFGTVTSDPVSIGVAPRVTLTSVAPATVKAGRTVTVTGSVASPTLNGKAVFFQGFVNGAWKNLASGAISGTGTFSLAWKAAGSGTFAVRAYVPARSMLLEGASPKKAVTVTK